MTVEEEYLQKYKGLISAFTSGGMSSAQFESKYLDMFKAETFQFPEHIFDVLNTLFLDVDAYCADSALRDDEDLGDEELLARAKEALKDLVESDTT